MGKKSLIRKDSFVKFIVLFLTISLFLFSTAYALSNQLFTVSGSATIFNYGECDPELDFSYEVVSSWGDASNGFTYQLKLGVTNNSSTRIDGWTVTLKGPVDLGVAHANAQYTVDDGELTLTPTGNYSWAAGIDVGTTRDVDFQVTTAEANLSLEYLFFDSCMVITGNSSSPLMSFTVAPTTVDLKTNQSTTINIYKMPVDATADFVFSSDNLAVATVNAMGVITGVGSGSATITVSAKGITKNVLVTVSNETVTLTALSLSPKENAMKVGDEKTLVTTKTPVDAGTAVTYTSSDPSVATVDNFGKVTAIDGGTAVITASASGFSDSVNITVIRDAISDDLDATFSYQYYDSRNIQFAINLTNIGHSEIHKISFKISFPSGTTWQYWNNWPAMFQADNTGTTLTSTSTSLSLQRGSYINFTGNVMLPQGYSSADYLSPTIYDVEVE